MTHSIWELSSLTRDFTLVLCIGRRILNHWPIREVQTKALPPNATTSEVGLQQMNFEVVVGGHKLPWDRLSPSTSPSSGSDTEALSQAMPELAQRATETQENFYLRVSHRFPSIIVPCFQATPESQLPDSFCHSPCPTVCLGRKAGSYG